MEQNGLHNYKNFKVAIYARVYEVQQMADLDWLRERFEIMNRSLKINKIYLETHRDMVIADEATLQTAREFFETRGIQVSGGITLTVNERNRFQTYCYTNPEQRKKLKEVVEYTARLFNEVILDDFFFTNCKCETCIQAKGERSWTRFRLDLLQEAAQELIIQPVRAVNPNVELVVKYPNWYEHFQGLGFDLDSGPKLFDRVYTGTETRDPVVSNQHLQQYHGFSIFRYFENLKPGANGGGWVDTGGMSSADRYAEQIWLTLFAKAPEITLFDFRQLQRPLLETDRAAWQSSETSFDFDAAARPARQADGTLKPDATVALIAGQVFEQVDRFLDCLGKPSGVKCYKPYQSTGEDFLHSYLGMIGIPIDLLPDFPVDAPLILLTESAKFDPQIVAKIKGQLIQGKSVIITSGLLRALVNHGIEDIVELQDTGRKALVKDFLIGWNQIYHMDSQILIPQIQYLTNDSWEEISALGGVTGYPLLHSARYAGGVLYVLTIPDNFSDLYTLPEKVLDRIRETFYEALGVSLEGPSQVALFPYDNNTLIVESFLPTAVEAALVIPQPDQQVCDLLSGEGITGEGIKDFRGQETGKKRYSFRLPPHSYRIFRME